MTNNLAIVLQLLAVLPAAQLLVLLQTLSSLVASLAAAGKSPVQILNTILPALQQIINTQ